MMTQLQNENTAVDNVVRVTGQVLAVGNGAVGKTSIAKMLQEYKPSVSNYENIISKIRRTNNLEFEFLVSEISQGKTRYSVVSQILVPPGQKKTEMGKAGRTFEQVMDLYRFHIKSVDIIILTYNISARNSFIDLKYWLNAVNGYYNPTTNFLLVGTHLDQADEYRKVLPADIEKGQSQIEQFFKMKMPDWKGSCFAVEISNINGKNMEKLEFLISKSILWARGHLSAKEFMESYNFLFQSNGYY
ncbi:MAG: hypothetical protein OEV06_01665 [Anaerolineae bacterium]|nr:hypothetical protein [Anaerolineae bacterium]